VKNDKEFFFEEEFHARDRKYFRKERKLAAQTDRSKYKKTDQDQLKKRQQEHISIPLGEELKRGRILAITPEGILVDSDDHLYMCTLKGALKQDKSRLKNLIAVGDFVRFSITEKDQGTIVLIEERRTVLSRADNLSRTKEQLIAVNIDQVLITASVVLPALKPALIDRYIIAAKKGNMIPVVVVNKIDLLTQPSQLYDQQAINEERILFQELIKAYQAISIPIIPVSATTGEGIEELKKAMQGKTSVFSGQSGVGKSSLINATTGSSLRTGDIVEKTRKGSHTTTTTLLLPLETGGFCIDTPGIRSFEIWDLSKQDIQANYTEFFPFVSHCRYPDCSHLEEPQCAVKEAVQQGNISSLRFASYCALINSLSQEHRPR